MPSSKELLMMNNSVRSQCSQLLTPGGPLLDALVMSKDSLTTLVLGAVGLMVRTLTEYQRRQKQTLMANAGPLKDLVAVKVNPNGMQQADYNSARQTVEQQYTQKWVGELQQLILSENSAKATGVVQRWVDCERNIEAILDRMRLQSIEPSSLRGGQTLEELLSRSHLEADVEMLSTDEIDRLLSAEQRLDPAKFELLLPICYRIAKTRSSQEFIQAQTRKLAVPQRSGYFTGEAEKARSLRGRLDALLASRKPKDLEAWDDVLEPQCRALVKAVFGIDVRELSEQDFARYSKNWKPGGKISELWIDPRWPLRMALEQVNPRVRSTLSAKLA